MSIKTYSAFNYGHTITDDNKFLNFDEGAGEITAQLPTKSFTLGQFVDAIANAMNNVGGQEYTVILNRATNIITISAASNFDLLGLTGSQATQSVFSLAGFSGDLTGSNSYEGQTASGERFEPQNILQNYTDFEDNVRTTSASVNESASGSVEVVSFGKVKQAEFNIVPQTNILGQGSIKNDPQGVENLRAFLEYCTNKAPIEFVPDIENPNLNIRNILLESTRESRDGVNYKVKRFRRLFGYYESGTLVFREI